MADPTRGAGVAPLQRFAGPLLLGAVGVAMAAATWGGWLDVQVDVGRELYVPWRLVEGSVLYRDIAWFNGPLSQYGNAATFAVFGVGLRSLVWTNLALAALTIALCYALVVRLADRPTATIACLVGLVVHVFNLAGPNFNFVTPYSHELTHGLLLALTAVTCLGRFEAGGRRAWMAAAGAAAGLAALTKPEIAAAVSVSLATGWLWLPPARRQIAWLPLVACAALPGLLALSLLCLAMPVADAASGLSTAWASILRGDVSEQYFYRRIAGFTEAGSNLRGIGTLILGAMAWFVPVAGVDLALRRRGDPWAAALAFAATAVALAALWRGAFAGSPDAYGAFWRLLALRPMPLLLALLLAGMAVERFGSRRDAAPPAALRAGLVALALALLVKIILRAGAQDYGFALALPGTLVSIAAALAWAPAALRRRGGGGRVFRAAVLPVLLVLATSHLLATREWMRSLEVEIGSGADAFRTGRRGNLVNRTLARIEETLPADATLAVLPEGVMLNFLTRRRNPTPYLNFMPPELLIFGEKRMVAGFAADPPDAVVLWHKTTYEYGLPLFGSDYGEALYDWLRRRYRPFETIGREPLRERGRGGLQILLPREGGTRDVADRPLSPSRRP